MSNETNPQQFTERPKSVEAYYWDGSAVGALEIARNIALASVSYDGDGTVKLTISGGGSMRGGEGEGFYVYYPEPISVPLIVRESRFLLSYEPRP